MIKTYSNKPEGFISRAEVAATYVEVGHEILLLQRAGSEKGCWGIPAGRLEQGESPEVAAKRELFEETGITSHLDLTFIKTLYIHRPSIDYTFHMFKLCLSAKPDVVLSHEHLNSSWLTPNQIKNYPLMEGALEAFSHYQELRQ